MKATSLRFAAAARSLGQAAHQRGLVVPGFRSPPRVPGAERTLRRRADGGAVVAVSLRGRPFVAVVADMVEGVVVANGLTGVEATRVRTALWEAVATHEQVEAA
jgi:hypothetical protein